MKFLSSWISKVRNCLREFIKPTATATDGIEHFLVVLKKDTKGTVKLLQKSIAAKEAAMKAPKTGTIFDGSVSEWVVENEDLVHEIIESAYLRTLVREPTTREIDRSITYLKESPTAKAGIHDILWALLNTKEFALNH